MTRARDKRQAPSATELRTQLVALNQRERAARKEQERRQKAHLKKLPHLTGEIERCSKERWLLLHEISRVENSGEQG